MIVIVLLIELLITKLAITKLAIAKLTIAKLDHSLPLSELIKISVVAFFIPSLTEEVGFRGLPKAIALPNIDSAIAFGIGSMASLRSCDFFTGISHLLPGSSGSIAGGDLGLFCTAAYIHTGSLWASVLVHWLVVVAWKAADGARFLT